VDCRETYLYPQAAWLFEAVHNAYIFATQNHKHPLKPDGKEACPDIIDPFPGFIEGTGHFAQP
jgi:hypothetical protein